MRDAFYQPATEEQIEKFANAKGIGTEEAKRRLEASREKFVRKVRDNPFEFGFVPDIWIVAKAILRGEEPNAKERETVLKRTGMQWEEFAPEIRKRLGLSNPVSELLIMGANRAGKTDFAAKGVLQQMMRGRQQITVGFQELKTGKDVQMKRMWYYMPKEFKDRNIALKRARSIHEHISYSDANGFANSLIVMENGSRANFITYKMDVGAALEGMEKNKVWLDEEEPISFLTAARGRVASCAGVVLLTFTPVKGYTPVVAEYMESLMVVKRHIAYMLPKDNGEPCPWLELGLRKDEYEKLINWRATNGSEDPGVPEARPEDCLKWVFGKDTEIDESVRHRAFEETPRFGICKGGKAAVIWFLGSDNPYGTPSEVIANASRNRNARAEIKKRVYGIAEGMKGKMFPKFSKERHVIDDELIPKKLIRIMIIDPAPDRNWSFMYLGKDPAESKYYVYREWPGSYEVPGVGVPGSWAEPSDRKEGINDGKKGEAQESFGMGFAHYKFEWARIERWRQFEEWEKSENWTIEKGFPEKTEEIVAEWSELAGTKERIVRRIIDSRAASSKKTTEGENKTLFEHVAGMVENLEPASGQKIDVGVNIINDLLINGRLKIAKSCRNTIYSLTNWTNADGNKGACKDFVDQLRYGVESDIDSFGAEDATEIGKIEIQKGGKGEKKRIKRAGGI